MHSATLISVATALWTATTLAAPAASAGPFWGSSRPGPPGRPHFRPDRCLSDEEANQAADVFRALIQEYSDELALATLTEDFNDYSSAVNIIRNGGDDTPFSMTEATFTGRQAFMDGQGTQPQIPFETLKVWHGCDFVSQRWVTSRSAAGQATESDDIPVVGNVIIDTVPAQDDGAKYSFRIKNIYSEFNAAAWLVNLGVFEPEADTSNTTSAAKRSTKEGFRGAMI